MNAEEEYTFNIIGGFFDLWFDKLRHTGKTEEEIKELYNLLPTDKEKLRIIKRLLRFEY